MPHDTLVRGENEATGAPATSVFPGEAFAPQPGGNPWPNSTYTPPAATSDLSDWGQLDQGSFGQGFVFGFFCGCIALIVSYASSTMGSETKRGVRTGFALGLTLGIVGRVIAAASR